MKKHVLLIHGFGVDPTWHWYTWLARELRKKGYSVSAPTMPESLSPKAAEWVATIMEHVEDPENTTLCGHSLGALSLLLYLNIYAGRPFERVVLVSTPLGIVEDPKYEMLKEFFESYAQIDWAGVKKVAKKIQILHSPDDRVVPFEYSLRLSKHLGVKVIRAEGGHFLHTTFPDLLALF